MLLLSLAEVDCVNMHAAVLAENLNDLQQILLDSLHDTTRSTQRLLFDNENVEDE